ncbi:MAG: ATP-binding protein [bacterium]|jgi:signal transduction histidine kinase/putative methionine-R-sulfoxide reductase with GAF domain
MIPDWVAALYTGQGLSTAVAVAIAVGALILAEIAFIAIKRQSRADRSAERDRQRAEEQDEIARIRASNLARILEISNRINANLELYPLLNQIVEAVRDSLGFRMVLLRILNEDTGCFEAKAFAGLDQAAIEKLSANEVPLATFKTWMTEEFEVSGSYFISHEHEFWRYMEDEVYVPDLGERKNGEWHPMDSLFVPLWTRDQRLIGYLSVDDPMDRKVPGLETIETLEIFANQAVTAIENARLYGNLEEHIIELREATKRLKELNEIKSNFVATVSHELRTPLTSIRAYAETLSRDLGNSPRETELEFLNIIEQESQRLTSIVDNMLELSHMESGKVKMSKTNTDLCRVAEHVSQILSPTVEKKSIELELMPGAEPVMIFADEGMMQQMILNLVNNAIKFTPDGGRVEICLRDGDSAVEVIVQDNGIGIPQSEIDRIFDGFYQVDSSATRRYGGVGLGLAIVNNIVEWHDGKIWVDSEEGGGTCFTVSLPKRKAIAPADDQIVGEPEKCETVGEVPELIVDMIAEIMGAKTASLMLLNEENEELYVGAAMGLDEATMRNARVKVGESISGWVAKTGKPLLIRDIEDDMSFGRPNRPNYESRSLVSVPLRSEGRVIGVLNVTNKISLMPFGENDAEILEILADRAAYILERLRDYKSVRGQFGAIINSLQCLIDSRRFAFTKRGDETARLVVKLGRSMDLPEEDLRLLRYVSRIYDVGMVRVGDEVIRKRGELRPAELESIKRHPEEGVDIMAPIEFLGKVKEAILHHHERFDGKGYPGGVAGEQIPIAARILAVVDAYESMITERPYRNAMGREEAIEELMSCSGTQFDPQVVEHFIEIIGRDQLIKPDEMSMAVS